MLCQDKNKTLYICQYLLATKNYHMELDGGKGEGFITYSDSDWAGDPHNQRQSHTGYFTSIASCPVSWVSRTQKTIALSSTEAEYMAISVMNPSSLEDSDSNISNDVPQSIFIICPKWPIDDISDSDSTYETDDEDTTRF